MASEEVNDGEGLNYLEEMRLAKMVRNLRNGNRSLLMNMNRERSLPDLFAEMRGNSSPAIHSYRDRRATIASFASCGHAPRNSNRRASFANSTGDPHNQNPTNNNDVNRRTSFDPNLPPERSSRSLHRRGPVKDHSGNDSDSGSCNSDVSQPFRKSNRLSAMSDMRSSMMSNASAWKSMSRFLNGASESSIDIETGLSPPDNQDGHRHSTVQPFYTKPVQRQLWGHPNLVVHIGWNTLFFDLFYVAAAYNLGNLLISALNHPGNWLRGVVYCAGIFGGIYNIFLRCMMYDSQFEVYDYAHRLLEVVRMFLVSIVVLHIKSIDLLMDPRSAEAFALTTAMFMETQVHVLLNLELFCYGRGDTVAIKSQSKRELTTSLLPSSLVYMAASIVSGVLYFCEHESDASIYHRDGETTAFAPVSVDEGHRILGAEESTTGSGGHGGGDMLKWTIADVPIALCFVAVVVANAVQGIQAIRLLSPKNPEIRSEIVPMNIDFFVHRFGEFTMLFFGEAVMGLLIVETTESSSYYMVAMVGVLNVIVLQAFKFESEPHGQGEEHCLWRGMKPFFVYSLLTQTLCLGLIAFAVSFKVGLNVLVVSEQSTGDGYGHDGTSGGSGYGDGYGESGGYGDAYGYAGGGGDPHRVLAASPPRVSQDVVSILYCSSLTIILVAIELMAYSHKGFVSTYSLFVSTSLRGETRLVRWKRLAGTLFKIGLVGILSTLFLWVEREGVLAAFGFGVSVVFASSRVAEEVWDIKAEDLKRAMRESLANVFGSSGRAEKWFGSSKSSDGGSWRRARLARKKQRNATARTDCTTLDSGKTPSRLESENDSEREENKNENEEGCVQATASKGRENRSPSLSSSPSSTQSETEMPSPSDSESDGETESGCQAVARERRPASEEHGSPSLIDELKQGMEAIDTELASIVRSFDDP